MFGSRWNSGRMDGIRLWRWNEQNVRWCYRQGEDCSLEWVRNFLVYFGSPVGVFEFEKFSNGTKSLLRKVAEKTEGDCEFVSIIGGGDTASAAEKFGVANKMSHVSTGGGASLELLEGRDLPGILSLSKVEK